jgi:hypothetical protein
MSLWRDSELKTRPAKLRRTIAEAQREELLLALRCNKEWRGDSVVQEEPQDNVYRTTHRDRNEANCMV